MAPFIAGIVTELARKGLGKVAEAVKNKGLEYVEDKLGVKIEPDMSPEKIAEIQSKAQEFEEFKIDTMKEVIIQEDKEVTERHKNDMLSDSTLSKNIRPITLLIILAGYFMFATMSAFNYNATEAYVELLGQWGMLIMTFYFGGRSAEKIFQIMKGSKDNDKT
jgi:membrane-associated HD superfamily phosphohydrolase